MIVQPVLVWDNGEELTPAEEIQPIRLPLSQLNELADKIKDELPNIEKQVLNNGRNEDEKVL